MSNGFTAVTIQRSYQQIVGQIEERIRNGDLVAGERLPSERELSQTFGVSRMVIREAIKVLTATGLVEPRQGSGVYVRNDPRPFVTRALTLSVAPGEKSLRRLFELRQTLEARAVRDAAERRSPAQSEAILDAARRSAEAAGVDDLDAFGEADQRFHVLISEAADNPYLGVCLQAVRDLSGDVVELVATSAGSLREASRHHIAIAEAIARQDAVTAAHVMDEHICYTASVVEGVLQASMTQRDEGGPARHVPRTPGGGTTLPW